MPCLDDNTILELVEQVLPAEAREAVTLHLDACSDCRGLVADISLTRVDAPPKEGRDAIGRYVLLSMIGAGGMGVVHAAFDRELDRKVALKFLASDPGEEAGRARARLQREAQALAKLTHPNVITVHDVGLLDGEVFVAMELVAGGTLREWVARAPRRLAEILAVLRQAGEGLAAAHAAGLVHRDFKPENVLVGDDGRVRVTDFGLARAATPDPGGVERHLLPAAGPLTRTGVRAGTPAYMAPEQQSGGATDARSDVYAYCVTLHEAVTGARPAEPAPGRRRLPAWLDRIVARGLQEDPVRRWASMRPLLDALARGPLINQSRAAIALGLVLLAALPALALGRRGEGPPPCQPDPSAFAGVWDAAARSSVRSAFVAAHPSHAGVAFADVDEALGGLRDRWIAMRASSCAATLLRHEQSAMLLDLRTACLDAKRGQAAALVQVLAKADRGIVEKAPAAATNLSSIDECANVRALEAIEPLPADPSRRRAVEEGLAGLAKATALHEAGKEAEGLAVLTPVLAAARADGYRPLEAKLLVRRGQLLWELARPASEVEEALHEAARSALSARDDASAAEAWTLLAFEAYVRPAEGYRWAAYAESAIARLGGDDYLEAERSAVLGAILSTDGHYDEARASLERARGLFERTRGPTYYRIARCDDYLGNIALGEQRVDDAYRLHRRSRELRARVLGPDHKGTIVAMFNESSDLIVQGRFDEALAMLRDIDAAYDRNGVAHQKTYLWQMFAEVMRKKGAPAEALAYDRTALAALADDPLSLVAETSLTGEAVDLIALGRPAEAIAPLTTSLKILATSIAPERSTPLFALARALDATGGDRARVASLAREAEAVLAPFAQKYGGKYARDLAEMQAWERAREQPKRASPGGSPPSP